MTVGIYSENVNHFIETLVYFLSFDGYCRVLLITDIGGKSGPSEHPWCMERLKKLKNIDIVPLEKPAEKLDRLYFHISGKAFSRKKSLTKWIHLAKKVGCLKESHYRGNWKKAIKELIHSFPYYLSASSVILQDSRFARHPYGFIRSKHFYSPSVHPQFFSNKDWGNRLFSPVTKNENRRPFKFTFIGARNPFDREALLRQIKKELMGMGVPLTHSFPGKPEREGIDALWIEYGDTGATRGLNPACYAEALGEADFCICPLGWGGNWTHRVPESLLRGAIPVLEDEKRYNIGLEDMQNCIVVKNHNWSEAIKRAYGLGYDAVRCMRRNALNLREKYLLPKAAALRLRNNMGIG